MSVMTDISSLPGRKTPLLSFPAVWGALKVRGPPPILTHSPLQFEIEGLGQELELVHLSSAVLWVELEGRDLASPWEAVSCPALCLLPPEGLQLLALPQTWLLLQCTWEQDSIHVLYDCMSHI